jgi:hypothetical protein
LTNFIEKEVINLATVLQAYTTTGNTEVISDTAASPGTLPTPAVAIVVPINAPLIDGNDDYIWSPNIAGGQTVGFQSIFPLTGLPIGLAVPISVYFSFAANETATVSATLEVLNLLGTVILSTPLFTGESNGGDPQNVANAEGDALLTLSLLTTSRIVVDATVTAPTDIAYVNNPPRYLGQLTVQAVI